MIEFSIAFLIAQEQMPGGSLYPPSRIAWLRGRHKKYSHVARYWRMARLRELV